MKISRITISVCLCIVLSLLCSCSCVYTVKEVFLEKQIVEKVNSTSRNKFVAYVDSANNIYFHHKKVEPPNGVVSVLYISEQAIYYLTASRGENTVYRARHDYSEKEKILSYNSESISVNMPDEDSIFYVTKNKSSGNCYLVKHISTGKTEKITEEHFKASYSDNEEYTVNVTKDKERISIYSITNKKTNEKRIIDEDDMQKVLKIEEAKILDEYTELWFLDYVLKDEKIYLICGSYGFVAIFQYDFETENITFVDWQASSNMVTGEIKDVFLF